MANENETQEVEVYQVPAQGLMLAQDLPDLDSMSASDQPLTMTYLVFEKGQVIRANYAGIKVIKSKKNLKEGEDFRELDAVVLQTKDNIYLNSGANLVEQLRMIPIGTPVQVTFSGKEQTTNGNNVNKFDVRPLSVWKPKEETVSKWNDLTAKAKAAGITMNFDIGASPNAAALADRVAAINAALKQKLVKKL